MDLDYDMEPLLKAKTLQYLKDPISFESIFRIAEPLFQKNEYIKLENDQNQTLIIQPTSFNQFYYEDQLDLSEFPDRDGRYCFYAGYTCSDPKILKELGHWLPGSGIGGAFYYIPKEDTIYLQDFWYPPYTGGYGVNMKELGIVFDVFNIRKPQMISGNLEREKDSCRCGRPWWNEGKCKFCSIRG